MTAQMLIEADNIVPIVIFLHEQCAICPVMKQCSSIESDSTFLVTQFPFFCQQWLHSLSNTSSILFPTQTTFSSQHRQNSLPNTNSLANTGTPHPKNAQKSDTTNLHVEFSGKGYPKSNGISKINSKKEAHTFYIGRPLPSVTLILNLWMVQKLNHVSV